MTRHRLQARGIAQARLAELFDEAGCPLCRQAAHSADRFIGSMLWERVSDVAFQRELVEARGFCGPHTTAVVTADRRQMGGTLGSAILEGTVLGGRLHELDEARRHRGRTRTKKLAEVRARPRCPVCAQRDVAVADAVAGLLETVEDPAWADAMGGADFCLDHLVLLMAEDDGSPAWRAIEDRQLARLQELRDRLAGFVHHSSHDRRHLRTAEEDAATGEAARVLGADT